MSADTIYLLTWSGSPDEARRAVEAWHPGREVVPVSKRELRERGWRGQVAFLRKLEGRALVIYSRLREDIHEPQLLSWATLLHRCDQTVFLDATGAAAVVRRTSVLAGALGLLPEIIRGLRALLGAWLSLLFWRKPRRVEIAEVTSGNDWELAYLYPYPLAGGAVGGANSHVRGLLSGLADTGVEARIFSARSFDQAPFPVCEVPQPNAPFLLKEALLLSYNRHFRRVVQQEVPRPAVLYQRHGRFVYAGAALARALKAPLVLEYNGSEEWVARHWDPSRFRGLLRRCEQISLHAASLIVVVSDVLRDELIARGVPAERILVNPNGFDARRFQPGCGGAEMRARLGIAAGEVVVTFVGSFSYWHGVTVLAEAIKKLARPGVIATPLRFLLVGEGPFAAEIRDSLRPLGEQVRFTGTVPNADVPAYLDASDILCSPHVRMPDGQRFFGSPTKLFEYMAMQKAIVASRLDQLEQVLAHGESALLVEPGNVHELADAILLLAGDAVLRARLGAAARQRALEQYTWLHNAERLLQRLRESPRPKAASDPTAVALATPARN